MQAELAKVQCYCCDMIFYRREVSIIGNQGVYYNRSHLTRWYSNNRFSVPMTSEELKLEKYIKPGRNVIWKKGEPQPFVTTALINHSGPQTSKEVFDKLTVTEIAIMAMFITRGTIMTSVVKKILSDLNHMSIYDALRKLRRKNLVVKEGIRYVLTSKGSNMLDKQFKKAC